MAWFDGDRTTQYIATLAGLDGGERFHVHYHGWSARYDEILTMLEVQQRAPEWCAREARKRRSRPQSTPETTLTVGGSSSAPPPHRKPHRRRPSPLVQPPRANPDASPAQILAKALRALRLVPSKSATASVAGAAWPPALRKLEVPGGLVAVQQATDLLRDISKASTTRDTQWTLSRTEPDGSRLGTLLAIAAGSVGHVETLQLLCGLNGGAQALTATDYQGRTAAHESAGNGHVACLRAIAEW